MTLERDIIIDLLPAYFSGEASAATRTLVEEYFRENPDFEKKARGGVWPMEALKAPIPAPDKEKEKLALERARLLVETRGTYLWLGVCFTVILLLFKVRDHKLVWIMWENPKQGIVFLAVAVLCWGLYWRSRVRPEPMRMHNKFLMLAAFYTVMLGLLSLRIGHSESFFSGGKQDAAIIMAAVTVAMWISYFYLRWKAKHEKE
jgi:hypothetical protein